MKFYIIASLVVLVLGFFWLANRYRLAASANRPMPRIGSFIAYLVVSCIFVNVMTYVVIIFLQMEGSVKTELATAATILQKKQSSAASKVSEKITPLDPCAKCTVNKIAPELLTCEQVGEKWRFIGHLCVGAPECAACKVADCMTSDMEVAPKPEQCNRCSTTGD
jgi:hypothetical protein